MGDSVENRPGGQSRIRRLARLVLVGALIAGGTVVAQPLLSSSPSVEAAAAVTFDVVSAFTSLDPSGPQAGAPITEWKYRIDRDHTGDPYDDPADCEFDRELEQFPANFPDDCSWPSVNSFEPGNYTTGDVGESIATIVTHGDWTDFEPGGDYAGGITLDNGKYLVSVTAAGHKIGGAHFTVTDATVSPELITVALDPYPLPLVTLRARVFNDLSTNGQIDYPAEEVGPGESMAGFTATINDWADEVTTDWYGNPLCTEYVTDGSGRIVLDDGDPTPIDGTGGKCVSDAAGDIVIPNLGPNRYAMTIAPPPDDPNWIQTTTLEGGLDWDIWAMEGYTGFDTEFNVGGESVPWVNFGYVRPRSGTSASTPAYYSGSEVGDNTIKGVVAHYDAYTPGVGQAPNTGSIWGGFSGAKITGPIERPQIALLDLQDGDRAIWVGEGDDDGKFEINGVRDGEYQLTIWERDLLTLLDLFQVTVKDGQILDTGVLGLTGWFSNYSGHVFLDYNENGRMDPGEPGVPDYGLALLRRENAPVENGQNAATTGPDGFYEFEAAYPYTMWTVMEAYSDRYHTTGVTYQVSNQPEQTTLRGGGVDIHILPIIGQSARIDWGVVPYQPGENGSIAGTVFYDTTINELDARIAAIEDWSTGVPGITLNAYDAVRQPDGSWEKGALVDTTTSETWERPGPCVPRDADGAPIPDQLLFPAGAAPCLEAPLTGIQVDPLAGDELGIAVNGNFGFGDLDPGKYIVEIDIPTDSRGRPLYRVENEESVNVFAGDVYTPQNTVGSPSAGPDVSDPALFDGQMDTGDLPVSDPATQAPGAAAICVGEPRLVDITGETGAADDDGYGYNETNPLFADAGGTPYQGAMMPGCEAKLIEVLDQRSVAPAFVLYNDVPPPAHFWGYSVDDLNIDTNPLRTTFGEKRGLSYSPTGVYNWAGRLITQVNADVNGIWEVLLPSSTTMNCPSPAGVCPGMYRFVGNDPGPVTAPFRDYNPNYRTIAANFQAWPGVNTIADTAPTQVGASILAPGGQFNALAVCAAEDTRPHVFTVNRPYARVTGTEMRDLVITGNRFLDPSDPGGPPGALRLVDLDTDAVIATIPTDTWSDDVITATINTPVSVRGAYQLEIVRSDGARPVNSVTYHVIGSGGGQGSVTYNPTVVEVGPGRQYETVQDGVDAYSDPFGGGRSDGVLVVVYPNTDIGAVPVVPEPLLDFSIAGNSTVPGAPDSGDWRDSDVYTWDGSAFSRSVDSTVAGLDLPTGANVDGFSAVADGHFFMSFDNAVNPPGPLPTVQDEDVVEYDNGTWSLFFDGSANGIGGGFGNPNTDLDAISVVDGVLYFSTDNLVNPAGAGFVDRFFGGHPSNLYSWNGSQYTRILDAGSSGLFLANVDGMAFVDSTHFHLSFDGSYLLPGVAGLIDDEDVVEYDTGTWSLFFDGTAPGLTAGNHDIDAFDLREAPLPPPPAGPQTPTRDGVYYENVIISTPVMVQGVGAGGVYEDGTAAVGTIVHGGDFWASAYDPTQPFVSVEPNAIAWYDRLDQIDVFGDQPIADGSVFFVVAGNGENTYRSDRVAHLDGLKITGGDQRDFPGNVNQIGGGAVPGAGGAIGVAGNVTTQGGGVFLNGYANYFHITNNELVSNGGAYGGAIRVGSPFAGDNNNDDITIARNRIVANGGTQLAGAISIFNGADDYVIADNDICGNSSTEYGGGISHYGYSPNGSIHHNRVVLNSSYDEGGGINIAGELPADAAALSAGAGAVRVRNNMIASNLSNDDGGGLRFLQAGDFEFLVYNNIIANNVATHQGAGVALNDAPDVRILNNTIANNITTATAVTSDGLPAPAGLATTGHSAQLQATLPVGADDFSNPELVNNIFRDNRAGTWAGVAGITGIGKNGAADIELWDIGASDGSALSSISYSMIDDFHGADGAADGGNNIIDTDPQFVLPTVTAVEVFTWRGFQRFRSAAIVSYDVTQSPLGDYHVDDGSPAVDAGTNTRVQFDIDDQLRPYGTTWDIGADERPIGSVPDPLPPSPLLFFSTVTAAGPPGVPGPADDSDIYDWNGTDFSRRVDLSTLGLPGGADVDGLDRVDDDHFYVSFKTGVVLDGLAGIVQDEDVVEFDNGTWSMFFDGSSHGLTGNRATDLDAISVVDGVLYFSTNNNEAPPGTGSPNNGGDDADIYQWDGNSFTRVVDANGGGGSLGLGNGPDVDGLEWVDPTHFYVSFNNDVSIDPPGPNNTFTVTRQDVVEYLGGSWSLYFDGDGPGLIGGLDALDLPSATDPPPILNFASPAGFAIVAAAAAADVAAPPVVAEPVYGPFTPVLDGFERTDPARVNNTNINYGLDPAEWSGSVGNSRVRISGGERTLTLRNNGSQTWIGDEPFGDSQEAYVTVARTSSTSSTVGVFLRATDLRPNGRFQRASSYVEVAYAPYLGGVIVRTKRAGSAGPDLRAVVPATFGSGDTLLARINVNGDLEVHRRSGGTWELLDTMELGYGAMAWPTADTPHGGRIGINTTLRVRPGRLDDFGGGDVL